MNVNVVTLKKDEEVAYVVLANDSITTQTRKFDLMRGGFAGLAVGLLIGILTVAILR